jgi:NADH:ubiquinone oxidoreductase subunit 6 (subunit J)
MPFVKAGLPYVTQNYVAAVLAIGGIYLLLFHSSASLPLKLLIPFNYYFLYEFSVFARSYSLIMFLICAIICLYPKRFEKPFLFALCVAGLFNTHMLMFTFAAGITGLYLWDVLEQKKINSKVLAAFAIMCVSGLYLIPFLVMKGTANIFDKQIIDHTKEMLVTASFGVLLNENTDWGVLLLIALLIPLCTHTKPLLLVAAGLAGIFYILGYKFIGGVRHCGLLVVVVFAAYAIADNYAEDKWNIKTKWQQAVTYGNWLLAAIVLLQLSYTSAHYIDDIDRDYSDAKNVADVIKRNNLHNTIIAAYPAAYTCAIIPYLDKDRKFFFPESKQFKSFYVNASFYSKTLPDSFIVKTVLDSFGHSDKDLMLICNYPLKPELMKDFDMLYYSADQTIFIQEMFCLYKLKKSK